MLHRAVTVNALALLTRAVVNRRCEEKVTFLSIEACKTARESHKLQAVTTFDNEHRQTVNKNTLEMFTSVFRRVPLILGHHLG